MLLGISPELIVAPFCLFVCVFLKRNKNAISAGAHVAGTWIATSPRCGPAFPWRAGTTRRTLSDLVGHQGPDPFVEMGGGSVFPVPPPKEKNTN